MTENHVEFTIKIALLLALVGLVFLQLLKPKVSKYNKLINSTIKSITNTTIEFFYQGAPELYSKVTICYFIIHICVYKPLLSVGHTSTSLPRNYSRGSTLLPLLITILIIMANRRLTPDRDFEGTDNEQNLSNLISTPLANPELLLFPNITPGQNDIAMQEMNRRMTISPGALDYNMSSPIAQAAPATRHAPLLTPNPVFQAIEEETSDYFSDHSHNSSEYNIHDQYVTMDSTDSPGISSDEEAVENEEEQSIHPEEHTSDTDSDNSDLYTSGASLPYRVTILTALTKACANLNKLSNLEDSKSFQVFQSEFLKILDTFAEVPRTWNMIDVVEPLNPGDALRAAPAKLIAAAGETDAAILQGAKDYIEFADCDNVIYVILSSLIVAGSTAAARLLEHNGTGFKRHAPGGGRDLWKRMTKLFKDGSVAHKRKLK
jgi:hypothetical protein